MDVILIQQDCANALKGEVNISTFMSKKEKVGIINKDKSSIILYLSDKALKKLTKENIFMSCR